MSFAIIAAVAALGGLLFGYDTGVISGALLFIKTQMSLSATMEGAVVAVALAGAALGAATAGLISDRFGRRRAIVAAAGLFIVGALVSGIAPGVTVLLIGRIVLGFAIGVASMLTPLYLAEIAPTQRNGSLAWLSVAAVATFVGFFAIGLGPVFWLLIAEIFPLGVRGRAMSLATIANWVFNLVVSLTFLNLVGAIGSFGAFALYGILSLAGLAFVLAYVPETKGRTLEQIEASLDLDHPTPAPSLPR